MTIEDDIAFLERVPLLQRLGTGALRILAIGAESYAVQHGQVLFVADEAADCAYVVQEGAFTLEERRAPAEPTVAGPGTLLGESSLFAETRWPATATALQDSTVLRISRAMFLKMLESYPDVAQRLHELIARRAEEWAKDMEKVRDALARNSGPQ